MTIFGGTPDNPISGQTPGDTLGDDSPIGLTDQGDSMADSPADESAALENDQADAEDAVRDPSGLSE